MGNIINTAPCRFCGQMVQIDSEEKLTQPQAEEQATMSCTCEQAVEYQKEKQRKEKAMQNVAALFGEAAAPEKRCSEGIVNILKAAVEEIYTGRAYRDQKAEIDRIGERDACDRKRDMRVIPESRESKATDSDFDGTDLQE